MTTGDDLRLILRRLGGQYSLVVDNLTRNSSSTLAIAHPTFLDKETDLYLGLFGANTQSDDRQDLDDPRVQRHGLDGPVRLAQNDGEPTARSRRLQETFAAINFACAARRFLRAPRAS